MPRYWIVYDTETTLVTDNEGRSRHELLMGWAVYWDRVKNIQQARFFTTVDEFWEFVHSKTHNNTTYVNLIAHNAAFDLRVLRWHDTLFNKYKWRRGKLVILPDGSPIPFVVQLRRRTERLMLRDLANYYGLQSLSNIGKSVGLDKADDIVNYKTEAERWFNAKPGTTDWEILKEYCKRDTQIVLRAMNVLMEFLEENDLGSLSISAASQSKLAFRKLMPVDDDGGGTIHYHTDERRLELERTSYMGGRVEIFNKRGRIEGPLREFDFNSMYPSVLLDNIYPVRTISQANAGYRRGTKTCTAFITHDRVVDFISDDICIVARVTVDIPFGTRAHIPLKHNGKLLFPTGVFETTLTTPELLHAFEAGHVKAIHEYSLYKGRRDLFKPYVDFFYTQRINYKEAGNRAFEQLCKLFMNSLYGKFGQFSHEWEESEMPEGVVTPGTVMQIGDRTYRNFGGVTEIRSRTKIEPSDSFAAIAAHVTAYGRNMLREAMDVVGENVVYCDTDSIHVKGEDWTRLAEKGMIHDSRLGALKQEDHKGLNQPSEWGIYLAPKDYLLDGKAIKLKGIPKDSPEIQPGVWLTNQIQGLAGAFRAGDIDAVYQRDQLKRRHDNYSKGFVTPSGRITPWHFINGVQITDEDFYYENLMSEMQVRP